MSDTDIHRLVQHHDGQLHALNTRVGHVEQKLDIHDGKLDRILAAVSRQDAQPKFDVHQTIKSVGTLCMIFAAIAGGIIYLATREGAVPIAELRKDQDTTAQRLERVESLVLPDRWASKTERIK